MERWRLIRDFEGGRGAWNMAVDEVLFRAAEKGRPHGPLLRLYSWVPPCLSIGYHQLLEETCDESYCASAGIEVVRRPTGGKAVLHAEELTYAVIARQDMPPFAGLTLMGTYALIAQALAGSLRAAGLEVSFGGRGLPPSPKGGSPCFLLPSEQEITVGGRKVVGSAQLRGARAFLQHGAIPLSLDYQALALASAQPPEHVASYRQAFAGVAELKPDITLASLTDAVVSGFQTVFAGPWEERGLDEQERDLARSLARDRYGTAAWTRKGSEPESRGVGDPVRGDGTNGR
jgi:lipoyl(octanoyl) transferase